MPASSDHPSPRSASTAVEFLVGQHSLFFAGIGQAFFYLRLFGSSLPVWIAGPLFLMPWGIVFILFYEENPLFSSRILRWTWMACVVWTAALTVLAEALWALGFLPPTEKIRWVASVIFVQVLMNFCWLSIAPLVHDYRRNWRFW